MQFLESILDPIQLIGYIGMTCALISYQCKTNKFYFILQTACSVFFMIQFALLGSWAGMMLNVLSVARGVMLLLGDRCRGKLFLYSMVGSYALGCLAAALFFGERWWIAILLFIAQSTAAVVMWSRDGKKIRIAQISVMSPLWIVNNVYYGSIGGIMCEVFNITSVLVSFIRFRKTGYDKT